MTKQGILKKSIKVSLISIAGALILAGTAGAIYNASQELKVKNKKDAFIEEIKFSQEFKESFTIEKSSIDDDFINGRITEKEYIEKVKLLVSNEYAEKIIQEGNDIKSKEVLVKYNKNIDTYKKGGNCFLLLPLSSVPLLAGKAIKTQPKNVLNEENECELGN